MRTQAFFSREAYITLGILTLVVVLLVSYVLLGRSKPETTEPETDAARALATKEDQTAFTDLSGDAVDIAQQPELEIVVVTVWASWCPPCVEELAKIGVLADELSSQPVRFLAINRSDPAHIARSFVRANGISTSVQLVLDEDDRYFKETAGYQMPETVIYDGSGAVSYHSRGSFQLATLRSEITAALQHLPKTNSEGNS